MLNAGVATHDLKVTGEGWEVTPQVNVLNTALLGVLSLQKMAGGCLAEEGSAGFDHLDRSVRVCGF